MRIVFVLFLVESLAMKCAEETKSRQVCSCLYNFYLLTEQMDKVKQLLQVLYYITLHYIFNVV